MARETKQQREAREQAEREAYEAELAANYPQRLMEVLERAQNVQFNLTVKNGTFQLRDSDPHDYDFVALGLEYDETNQMNLEELAWILEFEEKAQAESTRQMLVRQSALAKLSKEEKELLGL
jgi:hypothetical protein